MTGNRHLTTLLLAAAAAAPLAGGLAGCRGQRSDKPPHQFLPDMDDQQKWRPQQRTEFFADGRTMRNPVGGTVAFASNSSMPDAKERSRLLKDDSAFYAGVDASGQVVPVMPPSAVDYFRPTNPDGTPGSDEAALSAMISRGQERYNIYCAVCHSYNGNGQGTAGARWSYPLPSYHDPKYTDRSQETGRDGHLFQVIRNGVADPTGPDKYKMPPYANAIKEPDAWAIVAYLRTLQASWTTDLDAVPAEQREQLRASRERLMPKPQPGAKPAAPANGQPAAQAGAAPANPPSNQPAPVTGGPR